MDRPLRIGALISGGGRTLLNLADCINRSELNACIAAVVSSRSNAAGVERARDRGLEVDVIRQRDFESEDAMHDAVTSVLLRGKVDLVCLCGYLRWMRIDAPFRHRVINIHPALLPAFGGKGMFGNRVHQAVLAAGRAFSGCTVHLVDEQYDHGPTILQRTCPVRPDDDVESLAARVFARECIAYPQAIRLLAAGRVQLSGGTLVLNVAEPTAQQSTAS